jgi:MYXO-CTERM domain-containing protein
MIVNPAGQEQTNMDFIEQWFGVSPDGGDGSLELLWIVAIAVAGVAFLLRRRITAWLARRRPN